MPKRSPTRPTRALARRLAAVALALAVGGCGRTSDGDERGATAPSSTTSSTTIATTTTAPPAAVDVAVAGDIACAAGMAARASECQMDATAKLVEALDPSFVIALGDQQYDFGKLADFQSSYDATWGRFRDRTRPVVGNHEYAGGKATGYFAYWGDAAAPPDGWYSFDVPEVGWHVVVLNSVCSVVSCAEGSAQTEWLKADLAAHAGARCTLAAFHHPRWSSGLHGDSEFVDPLWRALVAGGADVVLSGHDHHYERFAEREGVRQFVAGTGGRNLYPVIGRTEGSEFVDAHHFGILELALRDGSYGWRFREIGGAVVDEGQSVCR